MTDAELKKLVAEAMARFNALTPEQQEAHREAQRKSYVRSEMSWGDEGTRLEMKERRVTGNSRSCIVNDRRHRTDPAKVAKEIIAMGEAWAEKVGCRTRDQGITAFLEIVASGEMEMFEENGEVMCCLPGARLKTPANTKPI